MTVNGVHVNPCTVTTVGTEASAATGADPWRPAGSGDGWGGNIDSALEGWESEDPYWCGAAASRAGEGPERTHSLARTSRLVVLKTRPRNLQVRTFPAPFILSRQHLKNLFVQEDVLVQRPRKTRHLYKTVKVQHPGFPYRPNNQARVLGWSLLGDS